MRADAKAGLRIANKVGATALDYYLPGVGTLVGGAVDMGIQSIPTTEKKTTKYTWNDFNSQDAFNPKYEQKLNTNVSYNEESTPFSEGVDKFMPLANLASSFIGSKNGGISLFNNTKATKGEDINKLVTNTVDTKQINKVMAGINSFNNPSGNLMYNNNNIDKSLNTRVSNSFNSDLDFNNNKKNNNTNNVFNIPSINTNNNLDINRNSNIIKNTETRKAYPSMLDMLDNSINRPNFDIIIANHMEDQKYIKPWDEAIIPSYKPGSSKMENLPLIIPKGTNRSKNIFPQEGYQKYNNLNLDKAQNSINLFNSFIR